MTEKKELYEKLSHINLVAIDVDGTYTNGLLHYDSNGNVGKSFHAHDGFALQLLKLAGIKRGFITGRDDTATRSRAEYLKVDFYLSLVGDKSAALHHVLSDFGIPVNESMFIGDDLNDLKAFEVAGISVAVANASREIKKRADFVTETCGGSGAVREVVEMILRAKKIDTVGLWNSAKNGLVGEL